MKNLYIITGASSEIGFQILLKLSKRINDDFLLQVFKNKNKLVENKKLNKLNKNIYSLNFSLNKNIHYFISKINKSKKYRSIIFIHLPSQKITLKKSEKFSNHEINSQIMVQTLSLLLIYRDLLNKNNFNKLKVIILNSKIINNDLIPGALDYTIAKFSLQALYKNLLLDIRNSNNIYINAIYPPMFESSLTSNIPKYLKDKIKTKVITNKIVNKINFLIKSDVSGKDIII